MFLSLQDMPHHNRHIHQDSSSNLSTPHIQIWATTASPDLPGPLRLPIRDGIQNNQRHTGILQPTTLAGLCP